MNHSKLFQLNPRRSAEVIGSVVMICFLFQYWQTLGSVSRHMLGHIITMTIVAPICAWFVTERISLAKFSLNKGSDARALWLFTVLQLALFFAWHSPPGMSWAMQGLWQTLVLQGSLFFVALGFWICVKQCSNPHRWHAIIALLATGKLFCLVAMLLVFSPRFLYSMPLHHGASQLADQHLAGSIMVVLCPLTYVLSAVILLCRWFYNLVQTQGKAWPHDS